MRFGVPKKRAGLRSTTRRGNAAVDAFDGTARRIADLSADSATQTRVDELADKASERQLTDQERAEYAAYRSAFHFVTILQTKARR